MSVFVYWLDAEIQASGVRADPYEDQGLSWEYRNDFLSPTVKFYWKFRYPYNNPVSYLDAQIFWYADSEGPSILSYPSVGSDLGSSATVGSQCTSCKWISVACDGEVLSRADVDCGIGNSWSQFTGQVKKFSNILYNPTNQSWYNPF